MLQIRKSTDRGHANHGWLDSHHSFSFGSYHDPAHMGFGPLRVINEDRVDAGAGFGTHGHRDMEIISYVLDGELAHKDNIGNGSVIRPGDVQRMSAGTGVMHSEFNHAKDRATHFLQIWIEPDVQGIAPGYEEKHFDDAEKRGLLRLIASPDGRDGSVVVHQNARVYAGLFDGVESASLSLDPERLAYVHVATGEVVVNGMRLEAGDAVRVTAEAQLSLGDAKQAHVLVFDLPKA
ncbi:pirin family protein [Actimicrobium sp. CCI2.3]|uniref:pirin family protein n=1 Tax=Actimicrobium sp. CCI2.3 TaxID=3048616 RepID=UPI002AB38BB7|nr:pirin family protein [Actimicrobium sp. CCI2.3]MDY7576132.1 pirin family protein [Actimicrobium sp. CCI2.3]MEB0023466.1 pirin family protein [Actimicrobium sp. CCI2.3]